MLLFLLIFVPFDHAIFYGSSEQVIKAPVIPVQNKIAAATSTSGPICYYGSCYYYVGASQAISASGAAVSITQARPALGPNDFHTLAELAVESSDGQQIVETGWTVDASLNHDTYPHLFVYHWVNGSASCYNGCGYIRVSGTTYQAGSRLPAGTSGRFKITFANNQWQIRYNGTEIGYFPESLWNGGYKQAGLIQTFGEVSASATTLPHTQMGDGILGSVNGAAKFSNFTLVGTTELPALSPYIYGDPSVYNYGNSTATGLQFGGPGYL